VIAGQQVPSVQHVVLLMMGSQAETCSVDNEGRRGRRSVNIDISTASRDSTKSEMLQHNTTLR
jgi:hypothetical protein